MFCYCLHFIALSCFLSVNGEGNQSMLLQSDLVDLKGREAVAILRNSTSETLYLKGFIYNMIPYNEESYKHALLPGAIDSISFVLSYPEFLSIETDETSFRIYMAPGKRLICDIKAVIPGSVQIGFKGTHSDINQYYLAHSNHFGSLYEANRPYYIAGDTVKNFDNYPKIADSLAGLSSSFLDHYSLTLPT